MKIDSAHLVYRADNQKRECDFHNDMENQDVNICFFNSSVRGGQRIKLRIVPKKEIKIEKLYLDTDVHLTGRNKVFLNGYQSWTESREFQLSERIPRLNKFVRPLLKPYGDYGFYRIRGTLQSWTYTYYRDGNRIDFAGSLSENTGFTIFEYYQGKGLRIIKDCKDLSIHRSYEAFDLFLVDDEEDKVFDIYFAMMNLPKPRIGSCTGWTSWYHYYTRITEDIILNNLAAFHEKKIPIDFFQIDDGYESAVGDWLNINPKFPRGMKHLAFEIKKCGYKAGLWLAPFVCDKRSRIYKSHPEWIIAKAGYNPGWNGFFYTLDFYNPEVRAYLKKVFRVVFDEWQYDLVKLDFLYAVALHNRKDKTRGQIMHEAMAFLRELAGDKLILGCGVPLGSAFGMVDYCRIGSDVGLAWEDKLLKLFHYRERVSTINSLTSTIGRRHLNGRAFYNDPDVFILRSKNNQLTPDQRYTLFLLNNIYGSLLFTSDNINEYTPDELITYESIFPLVQKNIVKVIRENNLLKTIFTVEDRHYLLLTNLAEKRIDISTETDYVSKDRGFISKNTIITIKPFQAICLTIIGSGKEKLKKWLL
jgi:alpha-galactosidase